MCTLYTTVNFPTECWCHFPEYPSMQYTYRVSVISNTTITTNKYRGFSAVESSRTIGSWCLWMNLTVKARHRQQLLLPLQSKCALYTPKWLMMPFPRISMHAVQYTQKVTKMWLPQDTGNKYCCHCIVNVHIVHHSEFSNRVLMPFPRISNHAVYSQRVCNVITTNKRWFFCRGLVLMPFPRIYQPAGRCL